MYLEPIKGVIGRRAAQMSAESNRLGGDGRAQHAPVVVRCTRVRPHARTHAHRYYSSCAGNTFLSPPRAEEYRALVHSAPHDYPTGSACTDRTDSTCSEEARPETPRSP